MADTTSPKFGKRQLYLATLGYFIEEYASTEAMLRLAYWCFAGVGQEIGRAVLSSHQTERTISDIKKIISLKNPDGADVPNILEVLDHLNAINRVRNALVHFNPNSIVEDGRTLSNAMKSLKPENAKTPEISVTLLDQMISDLRVINAELGVQMATGHLDESDLKKFRRDRNKAWQFKPPVPGLA